MTFKYWILAARPKTLMGAAAPVIVGGAYALHTTKNIIFSSNECSMLIPFLLCLLFALIMQIDANFINDLFDYKKGTDREDRLGPRRVCAQGWISAKAMKKAIIITSALACAVGFPLVFFGGWWLIAVGVLCVLGAFWYTTKLSYKGWGDLMVIIFFGIIPVFFTYYVMVSYHQSALSFLSVWDIVKGVLLGLATGFVIDCLLMVNNYRDRHQDAQSGKKTIVVRLGERFGLIGYWYFGSIGAVIAYIVLWYLNDPWCLLEIIYIGFHYMSFRKMKKLEGKALNALIGETSRNIMIFTIVTSLGLII